MTSQIKKIDKKGREGASVFISALVWTKSNLAVEAAYQTITFHKYDLPRCFLHTESHLSMIVCVSDVTVGGGLGVLPQKMFGLNGEKSCKFRHNRHGHTLL